MEKYSFKLAFLIALLVLGSCKNLVLYFYLIFFFLYVYSYYMALLFLQIIINLEIIQYF